LQHGLHSTLLVLEKDVHSCGHPPLTEVYTASHPRHEKSTNSVTLPL